MIANQHNYDKQVREGMVRCY